MKIPKNLETTIKDEIKQRDTQRKRDKQAWRREYKRAIKSYVMLKEIAKLPLMKRYTKKVGFFEIIRNRVVIKNGKVYGADQEIFPSCIVFSRRLNYINLKEKNSAWLRTLGDLNEELILKIISFHVSPNFMGGEYEKIKRYI